MEVRKENEPKQLHVVVTGKLKKALFAVGVQGVKDSSHEESAVPGDLSDTDQTDDVL